MPTGTTIPPPTPCNILKKIRDSKLQAKAHNNEPRVKIDVAIMNIFFVPNLSPAQPLIGIMIARANKNPVETHSVSVTLTLKIFANVGIATLTIVTSILSKNNTQT